MLSKNPYGDYKQQAILTMTPGELLITLFDETLKNLNAATVNIEQKNVQLSHSHLMRAQKIIKYLQDTLNNDFNVSKQLNDLYYFFISQIQQANFKKDPAIITGILPILIEMRNTFSECDKIARKEQYK